MRAAVLTWLALLAACSNGEADGNAVDVSAAANRAEDDIANYAAQHAATRAAIASRAPGVVLTATTPREPSPQPPRVAAPGDQGSEAAAADVVRRYVAAIGAGRYREAWALWGDAGKRSGLTADEFAATFAPYASFAADVGMPFGGDAGARQRFVTVPVRVTGTLKTGGAYVLAGDVVLHRVADGIEAPDPVYHLWRIDRAELKQRADIVAE